MISSTAVNLHNKPADDHQVQLEKVDFTPLLGTWKNLDPNTLYLLEMQLDGENGNYGLHAFGSGPQPMDWGRTQARMYAADGRSEPLGFCASFERGPATTHVSANLNQGILVVQSYTSYPNYRDRPAHFSKEYFRKACQ